jgi:hypothetical protein
MCRERMNYHNMALHLPLAVYSCRSHGFWVRLSRKATITPQKKNVGSRKMREMLYNALEEIEDIRTVTCWLHTKDWSWWVVLYQFFISFQMDDLDENFESLWLPSGKRLQFANWKDPPFFNGKTHYFYGAISPIHLVMTDVHSSPWKASHHFL